MQKKISLESVVLALALIGVSAIALADWTQGIAAFNAGKFQDASEHFTEITMTNPTWPGGYYMLGRCQLEMDLNTEAIRNLQKAFELDPADTDTIVALGQVLLVEKEYSAARNLLEGAEFENMPPTLKSQATILLASAMLGEKDAEAAVIQLEEGLREDEANPALLRLLGKAYAETGDIEGAFRSYSRAFALDSDEITGAASLRAALQLAETGTETEQKTEWYRRAFVIGTQLAKMFPSAEHDLMAGQAAFGAGEFETAEQYFRAALVKDEENATALYALGRCLGQLDRDEEAFDTFSKALEASPDEALTRRIHGRMGQIAACRLDLETASTPYRSAQKIDRAQEIEHLASQFADALSQLERLRGKVGEIRRMEQELAGLGDEQGVTAMRERAAAEIDRIAEIEQNLEAVRTALCR